jgi:polyhydroxyalkanoate depolymerase
MMKNPLMYQMYQVCANVIDPIRTLARVATPLFDEASPFWPKQSLTRDMVGGALKMTTLLGLTFKRPPFGIDSVISGGREYAVTEEITSSTPFCDLLHFKKNIEVQQPRVLVLGPISGHYATLLRDTIHTLLRDHDVYVTDWLNIRDVPISAGVFDLDEYVAEVIQFLEVLGPGAHLFAVCQPAVPALMATALMAEDKNPAQPATMTLMAGPIDTRVSPSAVNDMATSRDIEWFRENVITYVPLRFRGRMRKVYPGFLQISGFMTMNIGRHVNSLTELYANMVRGDHSKVKATHEFYEEYFAMMDVSAEFYLQTVEKVFIDHHLPRGIMEWRGRPINPAKIKRTALFTIEGELDDLCSPGQTLAAQDLCTGIPPFKRKHHVQTGVGHYGVFAGRRWEKEIYPLCRDFIYMYEK